MSNTAHIILAIVVAASLYATFRLVRRRVLKPKYSLLWLSVGFVMAIVAAVPGLLDWAAKKAGVFDPPNLLLMLAVALLLMITMHFSYELSRMENRIRTLAEESTLLRRRLDEAEPRTRPEA